MKVLVSTDRTRGQRKNDFGSATEGEPVSFGSECDGEAVDGRCGCRRAMWGLESGKNTTTMEVVDMPEMTEAMLADMVYARHEAGGWHGMGTEEDNRAWALADASDLIRLAGAFEPGMVVEKRGSRFQERMAD